MKNFTMVIRKDLAIEKLPFVIANTGVEGWGIPSDARYEKKVEKLWVAMEIAGAVPVSRILAYPESQYFLGWDTTSEFTRLSHVGLPTPT